MSTQDVSDPTPVQGLASNDEQLAALAALPDPLFVMKAVRDPGGEVVELTYAFVNAAAARLYGMPVEAVVGHGQCELFPSVRELGIFDTYVGVIDSGSPVSFDVPWFQENGVEGSFELTAARLGDGLLVSARGTTGQRQAEIALAETSRRYQLIAENASDVVALSDADGLVQWVSPSVTSALGWTPGDLRGTRLIDLSRPDDRACWASIRDLIYSGLEDGTPPKGVLTLLRTKSGEYRWMLGSLHAVKDDSGVVLGVVSALKDVDDLVHAREAAQADRAYLRAALDSLLEPHVLLEAVRDETGQIVDFTYADANPAALAYTRMEYQELVGARVLELLPGHAGAGLFDLYRKVVETGEPLVLDDFAYAQELRGGDERRYDLRGARVGDGLSFTWRDVTERHEVAQRLAESEEQYRLLAENAADVVMRLSPALVFEWVCVQAGDVVGWAPSDLVGRAFDDFIHPADLARFRELVDDAGSRGAVIMELRFLREDGTYRWVDCRLRARVDEDGTPVAMVGGLVDVAERKAAAARELDRLDELERFHKITMGRELKMIELKKEIEYLKATQSGQRK